MDQKEMAVDIPMSKLDEIGEKLNPQNDIRTIYSTLEKLGRLPNDFKGEYLLPLTKHKNEKIRLLAIKNIGKLSNIKYLDALENIAFTEENTTIRRETVSAIGRMRNSATIGVLLKLLNDRDPKVVLQVIRALLVFKNDKFVVRELKNLAGHPNELIQSIIEKEFFSRPSIVKTKDHPSSIDCLKNTVINGDVLEVLKLIPEDSIHLTFTSPPYYNARDYSIYQSYKDYLGFLKLVFTELFRVTKEGRFFILNTSPIIIPRISRQHSSKRYPIPFDIHPILVDIGWEFIDDIVWIKPEASAKDRNSGFRQHRKPLAYKPTAITEYLMVYRKKTNKLIDWNIRQYDYKIVEQSKINGDVDKTNTWYIDPCFDKTHTAVFPIELCKKVIKYYSFKNDLVFDPFGGSGTFGKAALSLERYFLLTEISAKYFSRIKENIGMGDLFNTNRKIKYLSFDDFKNIIGKYNDYK
jgi:DNA modification methylase